MNRRWTQLLVNNLINKFKFILRLIIGYFTKNKSFRWLYILIIAGCIFTSAIAVNAQPTTPSITKPTPIRVPVEELYFVDVMVRGRPVIQIGSLDGVSATERARIINRRIAALLLQPETLSEVTVHVEQQKNIATLRVNNRILMSVTQQDVQDYGLPVDILAEQWANKLNQAFTQPPLAVDVGQRVYITLRQMIRNTISGLPSLLGALVVVGISGVIARGVRYIAQKWAEKTEGDHSTEILIGRLSYASVWVIGSVIALAVLGINLGALLGALGLTSVAIGFAFKDVFSNYISGLILLAARPFLLGDQVVIKDYEGTIIQIRLRATTMKTYDGRTVYIPNQEVFQASIINNTASKYRRTSVNIGITYDADISHVQKLITDAVIQVEGVQSNPYPDILVRELSPYAVKLEVRFWVDSKRLEFLRTTSRTAQAIKETLQANGIEIATEIYTLKLRQFLDQVDK